MTRELKFRAWDGKHIYYLETMEPGNEVWIEPDVNDIMQFTGLKDKNGKEIYEGDVVLVPDTYKDVVLEDGSGPTEPANHLAAVVFKDGSFGVEISESGEDFKKGFYPFAMVEYLIGATEFEVIGNLYENPDLVGR